MHVMRFLRFNWGLPLKLSRLDQPLPSNLLITDFPLKLKIQNARGCRQIHGPKLLKKTVNSGKA